ncbi:hypothetical protein [Amaricoccus solimangrovi]|uniref:Protein ImuA n=1 Tax=Amaricoccus solimangrovi TaxID=2589815 RepID=A0A501WCS9_9RHOB|nr:hypothetical protein FJM51_20170 [Amaricoccus solimangrovi]
MSDGADPLAAARRAVWIDTEAEQRVPLGAPLLDGALGGGLARGRLHEIFACEAADATAASGFAAMLATRLPGAILWLRRAGARGVPYPPGLAALGLDPARLILATLPDPTALLRAAADAARCPGVGVVVAVARGESRALDLAASRRLALAAERSGATVLLVRIEARECPSAARTRWRVAAAPSLPLAGRAPGAPALRLELPRRRGGPPAGPWLMEWDRAERCLRPFGETRGDTFADGVLPDGAALPGAVPAASLRGPDPGERRIA